MTDIPHAYWGAHCGHDVGMRHDSAGLVSSTCHDCDVRYTRPEHGSWGPGKHCDCDECAAGRDDE